MISNEFTGRQRKVKGAKKKIMPSQLLELEAKKREVELNELRRKMREDQRIKFQEHTKSQGNHWRSATTKKQISGYSDMVQEHYARETEWDFSNPQSAQIKKRVNSRGSNASGKHFTKGLNIKRKQPASANQNSIESNFNKALSQQNNVYNEVEDFLTNIKMEKYKEVFIDNGIEDKETILELQEEHLEQMNLPLGHKLKIMK